MKTTSNGIFAAVFCALVASGTRAEDDGITADRYPDADTVTVDNRVEVEYRADGCYVTVEEDWTKALTEKGRRELSSMTIDYSRRYGTGEIVGVEIIGADGAVRKVDVGATLKEATDNSSEGMNIYDPLDKILSCAVPGIRVGETRHTVVRRTVTNPRIQRQWADVEVLESLDPIVRASVKITGPRELPLRAWAVRHPLGNVTSSVVTNDASIVYTWVATNSPQAFPEPNMPPPWTELQHLRVSTAADWPEISRWYWDISRPHLEKTTPAMTNKVEELGRDLRAIFKFVSQEIRYMGLTMEDTSPGYAPHDVSLTFENRYGVCRDKAALLAALLRIAGFEAYPVLILGSSAKMDPEIPLHYFNHAIVAVADPDAPDGYALMDPTDESSKDLFPSYLSDCSYLVARPEGERLLTSPVVPAERNGVDVEGRGRLAKDGSLLADYTVRFRGINDNIYRSHLLGRRPEGRRDWFESTVRGCCAGAELLKLEILPKDLQDTERALEARLTVKFPETLLRGATRDAFTVPSLSTAFGSANWILRGRTALEERKYRLKLSSTAATAERLTVDLAGAVGATVALPEEERIDGAYSFRRAFTRTGDELTFERGLSVGAIEFSPEEYLELREGIKRVEAADRKNPFFAPDRLAGADVRVLSRAVSCDLQGPRSWTVTNTVVKEILTYDGKKGSSELKFGFNPTWKTVELVSATVSNRNGQVARAGAKEINEMDAGWAASAPRYPASRQLVVNLPSVEIGSVIEYTTVTRVTDAPVPFYRTFYFDATEPTDFLSVRVGDWVREVKCPRLLPDEPTRPDGRLWRDCAIVTSNDFASAAACLRSAVDVEPADPYAALGRDRPRPWWRPFGASGAEITAREIRDWMAKYVRVTGPDLYELPLDRQLTPPADVLKERYATRLDYVRTMCALMRGAGYAADIVFAASDAGDPPELRRLDRETRPNVRAFAHALCRVTERRGGFLGLGGETRPRYYGTENEYAPEGTTPYDRCGFLDPETGAFGTVSAEEGEPGFRTRRVEEDAFNVRENGAVDVDVRVKRYGSSVAGFRKQFAEMLPEERSRYHQRLLGAVAQAASATSELVTDTTGYPAELAFSCYVPGYATVDGDVITLELPSPENPVPQLVGGVRKAPFELEAGDETVETVTVTFPEGYTEVEHLPDELAFGDPSDPSAPWVRQTCTTSVESGVLTVKLEHRVFRRESGVYAPASAALVRDWNRAASARASRTITVRRGR